MITIEVLISLLILFIVVATSVSALKQTGMTERKKEKYQNYYRAFFNIKDALSLSICRKQKHMEGTMNDFTYVAQCHQVKALRSYRKAFEPDEPQGNIGSTRYILYRIHVDLKKGETQKTYSYYKTVTEKVR